MAYDMAVGMLNVHANAVAHFHFHFTSLTLEIPATPRLDAAYPVCTLVMPLLNAKGCTCARAHLFLLHVVASAVVRDRQLAHSFTCVQQMVCLLTL